MIYIYYHDTCSNLMQILIKISVSHQLCCDWPSFAILILIRRLQGVDFLTPAIQDGLLTTDIYIKACATIFGEPSSRWQGEFGEQRLCAGSSRLVV